MDKTDVILREVTEEEVLKGRPFSHFGWEGNCALSFITISDGYWDSAKILLERMKSKSYETAVVDTLIYPLFFNYRHSIEAYLKALFFTHGDQTDEERRKFLNLGHKLRSLWERLHPVLNAGKKHVGSSVKLDAIEHYIKEIDEFDPDSMMMRYPIKKDLKTNKGHQYNIDFIHFGERMNELCNSLRTLYDDISNQMDKFATPEELNKYLEVFIQYKDKIDEFLLLLNMEKESINGRMLRAGKFLQDSESNLLILLHNLYYGGRSVNQHTVQLSISPVNRQKEFVRSCNELLEHYGLSFGKEPSRRQINIEGKQPSDLIKGISTSISILSFTDKVQQERLSIN